MYQRKIVKKCQDLVIFGFYESFGSSGWAHQGSSAFLSSSAALMREAKQITRPFIVKDGKKLIKMLKFWSFLPVLGLLKHLGAP